MNRVFCTRVGRPFKGYSGTEQFVEISRGGGSLAIAKQLADAGVIRDVNSFRLALWLSGKGRRLQAGEYRFDHAVTAREVADKIARGEIYVRPITFPEGLTIKQMAALYESKGFGPAQDLLNAAKDATLVSAVDPDAKDLEGYLFPDTYNLKRKETAEQLVPKMITAFMKALTPDLLEKADQRGLTVRQLVTLASIVEKETGSKDERPLVAAVYATRLRIGMPLHRQPHAREPAVRLAVQHVPISGPSARPHCVPRARVDRRRRESGVSGVPVLREQERRDPCVCEDTRRTQPQRSEVSGAVLQRASLIHRLSPPHLSFSRSNSK
jgi:hypothetical protein